MTGSPLDDIENAKAQHDIGVTGFRIYQGARDEGATRVEAFMITVAWFRGMIGSASDDVKDDDE